MKIFSLIEWAGIFVLLNSCSEKKSDPLTRHPKAMSYEVSMATQDTINKTDENGLKQGEWIIFLDSKPLEKGKYLNNQREGTWSYFDSAGNLEYTVDFNRDRAITRKNF